MLCTRVDPMLSGSSKAAHMQSCLSWLADPSDGCHASIHLGSVAAQLKACSGCLLPQCCAARCSAPWLELSLSHLQMLKIFAGVGAAPRPVCWLYFLLAKLSFMRFYAACLALKRSAGCRETKCLGWQACPHYIQSRCTSCSQVAMGSSWHKPHVLLRCITYMHNLRSQGSFEVRPHAFNQTSAAFSKPHRSCDVRVSVHLC